jgi:hypothetical protein
MTRYLFVLVAVLLACTTSSVSAAEDVPQWIIVTAPAFETALEPLCEHRRAEGMRVRVVRTTDVLSAQQLHDGNGDLLKQHIHNLCRETNGPNYVLLVGGGKVNEPAIAATTTVPTLEGSIGRMKGQPSDNGYGCLDKNRLPTVSVGRFPARSEEEVRQMVQKTLKFERDRSAEPWRNRLTLLVGNPGGASMIERRFAAWFVQGVARSRFDRLHPLWTGRIVIHAPGSPFCVPDELLREISLCYVQEGQVFSFYLGRSSAAGFWSDGAAFLSRDDWANLKIPSGQGVFFTCGCFGCKSAPPAEPAA